MPEEFKYQDKKVGKDENDEWSLKNLVYKKFKSIDNKKGGIVRDDKEILNAWWLVVNDLIKQIKQDKNIVWGKWALEPLNDLIWKKNWKGEYISWLKFEYDKLKGYKAITNNKDKINQIANMIDNAEKETLIRLAKNRTTQDSRNIIKQSNETNKNKPMFVMEWWNDYRKQTWCLIFTKASNPVRIDQALNWLFNDPNIVYEIDYSQCTNLKIKNKMTWLIGTQTCYLRYDAKSKTYTIRDKYWDGISQRAYIWEWVKLIPAWVRNWTAYQEQKKIDENLWKENIQNIDSNVKNMLRDIPSTNLNQYQQKYLFTKTDERILQLLKKAKKLWYELEPECVSKKFFGSWFMELHLNSWNSETDWTIWENPKDSLWSEIYNQLSSNAWEYKTYLTNRVKQKRQELDSLTKTETTDVEKKSWKQESWNESEDEKKKEQQHKQQVLYGIWLLETMINNYRESEWDSWLDNDDRNLVQIKQLIRNAKASIANANAIDDEVITSSFINPIRQKWALIKRISKTINSWQGQTYENPSYKQQYNQLKKVFFWSNNEQIDAIRDLWWFWRLFDKTETSFLQQEIENNSFNEEWQNFKVKYTKVNECIQKFYNYKVELSQEAGDFDESWNLSPAWQKKVKELDNLYEKAKLEKSEFANYLSSIWLLPPNWKTKNKMVLKAVESLQNKLNNTQKQLDNFTKTKDNLSEEQHINKLRLEQKENKTEEDLKELQALEYLEQNTEERDRINEVTLNMMKVDLKYWWINQLLWSSLFESLTELWWGAVWNNSKVYNDIIWYWFRNASDENAKLAWEIATEIAITVAVCVVTWWAGTGAIAAMLNVWSKAARATKWVRLANNIQKLVRLNNLWMKWFRIANTAGKISMLTTHAAWLLIEGTVFNAATNTIHSAMNGTSLDSLNLNPTAKENVQTAAFLWALSISWRLTQWLMKAWWKTKLSINLMKWLEKAHLQAPAKFTTWLVTEMGSMLAAEQTINFVFWHDIVNPETWEIEKSRKPELPTKQELTQIIGMILAFKMVKPWIWQKYTQKLNDWTLEICRSVKPNEILVRNPKTWEIVERINQDSINWNNKESGTKSATEKPIDSPTKDREATRKRQQELISKRQSHEKRKWELNKRKAELERRKSELLAQREANWRSLDWRENNIWRIQDILKNGHIITIDWLKYKFNGVKNGKAEFIIDWNAKKSAETSWKSYSEKVEVSSLEELLSSHFNLEPWNKWTNSWRYAKLNELIGEKVEPLDRLQNKIRNKKAEIKTLEEEIARLEKWNNTIAKNDYFEQHKNEIIGKNVRIDGVEYRAEHINKDGAIQFKQADWNRNFTVSSFKQLAEKWQVNGFSDWLLADWSPKQWSETLTKSERDNHQAIRNLISWETEYLSSRNMDQTINQRRIQLQSAQQELKWLEDKLPASQTRQQAISERARRWEELNKELWKLESELNWVNRELWEADRLVKKYQDEIDWIEKELPTEQQSKERQVIKPDIEGNVSPESVQKTLTQKEIFSESMWSDLHEEWRKGRLKEDWTYEPRIKETKDTEWISKNWTNQVDIANTKFEDLPSDWKYENLEAAKVAVDLVYEKILKWESISPKALEEMSSKVHEERLKRNSWAKWWELDVPYDKLPEVEKAKDRNQVLQAIEKVWWKGKRMGIENLFNNYRKGLQEAPQKGKQWTDLIQSYKKRFGEHNHEFKNIVKNNQDRIINLEKIEKIDSFMTESLEFLKKEMWIDDPNLKIKILEWTEWINNHYDRSTNTVYFSRNWWWRWQPYIKWWNKAEIFWGIWHELNHYLQEAEIIRHYWKGNTDIDLYVESILEKANIEWLKMIEKYRSQIDVNEPISERAVKYAESYIKAAKDRTIFDENWNILDYNKYRNLLYEKESFNRWDMLVDEYKKATKSYKQELKKQEEQRKYREEQERKLKEEQERKQKESNEWKDDIYSKTMSQQEKIEFNNAEKTNKAEFYINEWFNPKNVIYLPSWEKLYVTDKIIIWQARPEIVWYTLENWKMNIRLFYRSNSEWCWRSSWWVRISNWYSKWEFIKDSSYETTTKVDYKVWELFDKLDISKEITKQWYTVWQRIRLNQINNDIPYDEPLYREMKQHIKVESVMFPELWRDAVHFYRVSRSENVITWYNKLVPEWLNYSKMKIAPEKSYSYKHEYLGTVDVEAAQMKYKWKDVYIYFAKAKNSPNKVWIENIVYADAKINSFWVYDKQINAWPLVAKPMDYATSDARQVPGNRQWTRYWEKYMDIRDLYQWNPIIKEYKRLSWEKSYENNWKVHPIQQRSESQKNRIETKNEDKETSDWKDINTEEIQSRIDSDLSKLSNKQESGKVKLDRATKKTFQSWSFAQWIKNWINEHINIPNFSVPKEYIKNIRYKLIDNVTFWQNQLKLYYHEKILNKYKSIKTKIDKKMGKIDLESCKDEIDYINDTLEDLADLKEDLSNRHENSDNIEIISNDVDRIIEIREEIVEEFHDIIDIDLWDNQIWHWQDFIPPNQEIIDMDFSSPDNIIDDFGFVA